MSRSWLVRTTFVVGASLSALQACTKSAEITRKKPDPADVFALAKSYQFVDPQGPIDPVNPLPPGTGVKDSDAPTKITIARAVPTATPAPTGKVILALVNSDKEYKPLGIEEGDNYIYRDETDPDSTKWETYMVPVKAGSNPKHMKRDKERYSEGDHTQPRLVRVLTKSLVAFGACLDDPACQSGHCGYGDVD